MTTSEFQYEMVCSNYEEVLKSEIKPQEDKVPEKKQEVVLEVSEQTLTNNTTIIDNSTVVTEPTL